MTIKYGELTIFYNKKNTNIFTSLFTWFKNEKISPEKSKYIFLFDDGKIIDSDDKIKDFNYYFFNNISIKLPVWFEKKSAHTYFLRRQFSPSDFNKLFNSYSKFSTIKLSEYNCIYYYHKSIFEQNIFSIIHINSNENTPKFYFAYDSDKFSKEEIVYLIHYIFNHSE